MATQAAGLANAAATDAVTTVGAFSGEVWAPLLSGAVGAAALGALADRDDFLGAAVRLVGRVVDVLVRGGFSLSFGLISAVVKALVGTITGAVVGAFVGPGPVLSAAFRGQEDEKATTASQPTESAETPTEA